MFTKAYRKQFHKLEFKSVKKRSPRLVEFNIRNNNNKNAKKILVVFRKFTLNNIYIL